MMNNSEHTVNRESWRLVIGNINSFPINCTRGCDMVKMEKFRQLVVEHGSDIIMLSEHNRNMSKVKYANQPSQVLKKWWPNTIVRASFLASQNTSTFEPGGTMIVTHSRSTAHTCKAGEDKHSLGRWNFITIKGKHEYYTTFISVYRPATHQETYLRHTAYSADRRKGMNGNNSPDELWYLDLADLIQDELEKGYEVIVAGDFNDNLNDTSSKTRQFMQSMGLTELLINCYGEGPATHIRGSTTIDGVFASQRIKMVQGKYTSFDKSPSDHRWLVLDIQEGSILGTNNYVISAIQRKATSKIPSVKNTFQQLVEQKVLDYKLHEKTRIVYSAAMAQHKLSTDQIKLYESLEGQMQRIIKFADRKCRKVRRGGISASPEQKRLMGNIRILKQLHLRMLLTGKPNRPSSRRIQRLITKYKYDGPTTFTSEPELKSQLQEAIRAFQSFKQHAKEHRWTYLESLAKEYDEIDGKGVAHHYRILHHREQMKAYFKTIRRSEGKVHGGRVDRIQMEIEGEPQVIFCQEKMEKEIMRVNKNKLLQAYNTPLRQSRLADLLGEQGDFDKWEEILKGMVSLPEDVEEGLKLWFKYITGVQRHSPMDFHWTTEEYCSSWSKMKEEKNTLPGILVAHIKCLNPASNAADIISKLALIPFLTGYSPRTWRKGIDSMIPKKTADLRPEKLRLILLMDARFNHNNKLIGKKMMEYGEKHGLLAPEQYGSRKSKSAIEHATNKRIAMDVIRQSRTNAIYIANDAKSCYDRIILMVAYLTMRNFGIPALVAQSTIYTILNMKHYVRTKYGDSKEYYGGEKWRIKPHGCGQGNGYGPALWACISSPLLHIMRQQGYGTTFIQPISGEHIQLSAFSFVDDTDIIQTHMTGDRAQTRTREDEVNTLYERTQGALDLWSQSLAATGGALEGSKTFYVPMITEWKGNTTILSAKDGGRQLYLNQSGGERTVVIKRHPNESFFTLGIWQSPSGDESVQKDHLIKIIREWGQTTSINRMSWTHARIALQSTIGRTLSYSLPAIAMDTAQCESVQKVFLQQTLGKIGLVRTTPSLIACSPTLFGGVGLISFEVEQLVSHVSILLQHGPDDTSTTRKLIHTTLEYYALEAGLPGDPLSLPAVTYTTTKTWIHQTLRGMRKFNLEIKSGLSGVIPWCANDQFIMDLLSRYASGPTLATLNKVRMYLKVVTISDLLSADGKLFDTNIIQGKHSRNHPHPSQYRYNWPPTAKPPQKELTTWKQSICMALGINSAQCYSNINRQVRWNNEAILFARWIYSPMQGIIYEKDKTGEWRKWIPIYVNATQQTTRSNANRFELNGDSITVLPEDSYIISVRAYDTHITFNRPERSPAEISTASTAVTTTQPTRPLNGEPNSALEPQFIYNIMLHNGRIFSDGSYDKGKASYAFLAQPPSLPSQFLDIDYDAQLWSAGMTEGPEMDLSSYRAELSGILASVEYTNDLCKRENIWAGTCTLYCDSKGALSAAFGHKRPTPRWASYDLVRRIRSSIAESTINWKCKHVKGHQDSNMSFSLLSMEAKCNVIVDHLASKQLEKGTQRDVDHRLPWNLRIDNVSITGNITKRIKEEIYRPLMSRRWSSLLSIPDGLTQTYDWDAFFKSLKTQPPHTRIQLTKYNARLLPVGRNLLRRKHAGTDQCPCCGLEEDHAHVIRCTHPKMEDEFMSNLKDLEKWLLTTTSRSIAHSVIFLLCDFRHIQPPNMDDNGDIQLVTDQQNLGHRAFFAGLWHRSWLVKQQTFLRTQKTQRSADLWLTRLLHRIQVIPLRMWTVRNGVLHSSARHEHLRIYHDETNLQIDRIFATKPHARMMDHCDNMYFAKHSKEKIQAMRLQRKINWVEGAYNILRKYERMTTEQSLRFQSYFQWDRG